MKVLLCTPYLQDSNIISGGINIWGRNVLSYYHQIHSDITLDAVSFDRRIDVKDDSTVVQRAIWGIKEYRSSIKNATRKLVNQGPYDVLHLCTSAQLGLFKDYLVLKMAHKRGVKVVLHLHFGRTPELLKNNTWESNLLRRVLRKSDAIVSIDIATYTALRNNGFKASFYLPNPLSLPIINQIKEQKVKISHCSNKILYVGHVIPSKGVFELVEACNGIDGIELHLVGSVTGDVSESLKNKAVSKNKRSWLIIRGSIPHCEVINEMLSCGVFVLPSYTEGFPNVILEAMACGCPIVSTTVGAIPVMLGINTEEPCGICCPPKDVLSLKKSIQQLLDNPSEASTYAKRAVERVNEMYAMPKVWEQLISIWKSVGLNTALE